MFIYETLCFYADITKIECNNNHLLNLPGNGHQIFFLSGVGCNQPCMSSRTSKVSTCQHCQQVGVAPTFGAQLALY